MVNDNRGCAVEKEGGEEADITGRNRKMSKFIEKPFPPNSVEGLLHIKAEQCSLSLAMQELVKGGGYMEQVVMRGTVGLETCLGNGDKVEGMEIFGQATV